MALYHLQSSVLRWCYSGEWKVDNLQPIIEQEVFCYWPDIYRIIQDTNKIDIRNEFNKIGYNISSDLGK